MKITVKITNEFCTYEMTGDSSDQFDCWEVEQNNTGHEEFEVADMIAEAVFEHFNK